MNIVRARRPSAALVVSVAALIVALGGTSYAAFSVPTNSVGTKQLRNGAVTTHKLKNGAVTAAKVNLAGLTVPNANHANSADHTNSADHATSAGAANHATSATTASKATHANTAVTASALDGVGANWYSPVAYAHILANGTIDTSQSKGISQANVTRRKTASYCLSGLSFTPKNGSVAIDYGNVPDGARELAQLEIAPPGQHAVDCNDGENVEVATSSISGTFGPESFYLVLYL